MEQVPVLQDSPKQKKRASWNLNLRKSLAWDSAFFTSEGVLDPEELATVNSTFGKVESDVQDDRKKSFESSSSFNSGVWTNQSIDLLENVRISNRTSCSTSEEARCVKSSNKKVVPVTGKNGSSSLNTMKPPVASRKTGVHSKEKGTSSKNIVNSNMVRHGNTYKKESVKPPYSSSRVTTAPSKRISSNSVQKNSGKSISENFPSQESTNIVVHHEPCVAIRKPSSMKISSTGPSLTKIVPAASRSSSNGSKSTSFDQLNRTSQVIARKKVDCWNKTVGKSIPNATTKSRVIDPNSKDGARNASKPKGYLKSTYKLSSSVSTNSSIESSTSFSTSLSVPVGTNYSSETLDSGSYLHVWPSTDNNSPQIFDSQNHPFSKNCRTVDLEGSHAKELRSPCIKLSSEAITSDTSSTVNEYKVQVRSESGTKSSGLRMPSPKIGYFDVGKTPLCDSKSLQSPPKRTIGTGNVPGFLTPTSRSIHFLECNESFPHIMPSPKISSSIVEPMAHAALPPSTPSRKASDVNLTKKYEDLRVDSQRLSLKDKKGILTHEVGDGDIITDEHLNAPDVKCLDKIELSPVPNEAGNSNITGLTREGNSDVDEQFKQSSLLSEKLSHLQILGPSGDTEIQEKNPSDSLVRTCEKENLIKSEEKGPSSLKSLQKSGKVRSLLSYYDPQRLLQNSSASPAYKPVMFDSLPRTPLVEDNTRRHG